MNKELEAFENIIFAKRDTESMPVKTYISDAYRNDIVALDRYLNAINILLQHAEVIVDNRVDDNRGVAYLIIKANSNKEILIDHAYKSEDPDKFWQLENLEELLKKED